MKQGTVQQPLLSNGFTKKHVSTAARENSNNGRDVFHVVHARCCNQDHLTVAVSYRIAGVL
jgi:hypothetical protein